MEITQLLIPDISCSHCERTIVEAISPVAGVSTVKVDVLTRRVTVSYDSDRVSVDRLTQRLAAADYRVASVETPPAIDRPILPVISGCSCCSTT